MIDAICSKSSESPTHLIFLLGKIIKLMLLLLLLKLTSLLTLHKKKQEVKIHRTGIFASSSLTFTYQQSEAIIGYSKSSREKNSIRMYIGCCTHTLMHSSLFQIIKIVLNILEKSATNFMHLSFTLRARSPGPCVPRFLKKPRIVEI